MACRPRQKRTRERGLTVLELVIAVSLMLVILAVVAPILHAVQNSWDAKEGNSESLARARAFGHHFHRQVSQALRVTAVSDRADTRGSLQLVTGDGAEIRYELDAGDDIQFGPVGALTDLAGPVDALCFTCYDGNDFTSSTTDCNSIRFIKVEATFRNPSRRGRSQTLCTAAYMRVGTVGEGVDEEVLVPGVAMREQITWADSGAVIDSYRSSLGAYDPANPGDGAVVTVNAAGSSTIRLRSGAIIRGDVYIGPGGDPDRGISVSGSSTITGTRGALSQEVDIPNLSAPTGPPFDGHHENNVDLSGHETEPIGSDRYFNEIRLRGWSRLVVDGNVTVLLNNKLEMEDHSAIEVLPGSSLKLYVRHDATVLDNAQINAGTGEAGTVQIYMIGNNRQLRATDTAQIHAVIQNPQGSVTISENAQFFGRMKATELTGGGMIHVDLDADFE